MFRYRLLLLLLVTLFTPPGSEPDAAQLETPSRVKSAYIFKFIRYFNWQNEGELREFKLGVVGQDELLLIEMRKVAKRIKVKNIPLVVLPVNNISEMAQFQLLFITTKAAPLLSQIAMIPFGKGLKRGMLYLFIKANEFSTKKDVRSRIKSLFNLTATFP